MYKILSPTYVHLEIGELLEHSFFWVLNTFENFCFTPFPLDLYELPHILSTRIIHNLQMPTEYYMCVCVCVCV